MTPSRPYQLLPFTFERLNQHEELLVNEFGDYLFVPAGSTARLIRYAITPEEELYHDLQASFFLTADPNATLAFGAIRLRTRKSFWLEGPALHIFVVTLRCNQNCLYCQAGSRSSDSPACDMMPAHLLRAIDLAFQSPASALTLEFQGGEPTLCPDLLQTAFEYIDFKRESDSRNITKVLCSNCFDISDRMLELCRRHQVFISTSFDGPEALHNGNRGNPRSFQQLTANVERIRATLGPEKISALLTTSDAALDHPREIIDAYRHQHWNHIFLRPLNPYGQAHRNLNWRNYMDRFLHFRCRALDYILELNLRGETLVEEYSALLLRKILTPFSTGFVDLQSPTGASRNVVAYHCNGSVYASDEGRMLAEMGDDTFRLGRISDSYHHLFHGRTSRRIFRNGGTEYLAGCSDCVFRAYCGCDPVRHHAVQADSYGFRPTSLFCHKHRAIFLDLFERIRHRPELLPIFRRWAAGAV